MFNDGAEVWDTKEVGVLLRTHSTMIGNELLSPEAGTKEALLCGGGKNLVVCEPNFILQQKTTWTLTSYSVIEQHLHFI